MAGRGIGHATLGRPVKGGAGERGVSKERGRRMHKNEEYEYKIEDKYLATDPTHSRKGPEGDFAMDPT